MTVIRPNSVSGITSITAQANDINFFRSNGTLAGLNLNGVNFNTTSGVSTFAALNIEGVLTYQDVTNVDSIGIITARSGINVSGGQLTVTSSSKDLLYLNSTHSDGPQISIQTSGTTFSYIGGAASLFSTGSSTDLGFRAESGKHFIFGIGSSEKFRINSTGAVLIGTTAAPSGANTKLRVHFPQNTSSGEAIEISHDTNGADKVGAAFGLAIQNGGASTNAADFLVRTASNGSTSERLRITSGGLVGINTSNFSSSLNNEVGLAIHGQSNDNCRIVLSTPTKSNPPSIIGYYGLNRLGIDCHDGVEIRDVTASYATRFKIDQNGLVTKPDQPFVMVHINTTSNRDSSGSQQIIPWDVIHGRGTNSNVGSHFNTSNHRFTAPIAGRYLFVCSLNEVGDNIVYHRVNNTQVSYAEYREGTNKWNHMDASFIYDMNANDYYETWSKLTGTGQRWNGGGSANGGWDTLSIYLLG